MACHEGRDSEHRHGPTPEEFGIDRSHYFDFMPEMARQGLASGTPGNNPRVPSLMELIHLYELAFDGRLEAM